MSNAISVANVDMQPALAFIEAVMVRAGVLSLLTAIVHRSAFQTRFQSLRATNIASASEACWLELEPI